MRQMIAWTGVGPVAAIAALVGGAASGQPAPVADAVCISCHAEPNPRFHSQPSHKKLACATCHLGGAEHVADTRARPRLAGDARLCASCHEAKKKHGSGS